jgi:16S rRNA (uracil1498-N3)-methyltransferase
MTTTLHLPLFFSDSSALVEGDAHHHLFKVKRLQAGERLRLVDGYGHARWAEIVGIDKRAARLALGEAAPANEPERQVTIYVAAAKPERLAWLVEKATEIGVGEIRFVPTEREARSMESSQLARLQRIAISAVEQSGRSRVPLLALEGGLREAIAQARAAGSQLAVLDAGGVPAGPLLAGAGGCALFVGPEGGWSAGERELFRTADVPAAALGPTVLRVETAAVVAAGLALSGGDLSR